MIRTRKFIALGLLVALVFSVGAAIAEKPDFQAATVTNQVTGEPRNTVTIPARAVEVAPNVFYLGAAARNGRKAEGYAIITYRKGFAKPGTECGNGVCEPGENARKCPADCDGGGEPETSSCYGFLARGAKWKSVEEYVVDPSNTVGLGEAFVRANLASDIQAWETAAGADILGDENAGGTVDGADTVSPDDKNEVYFGDISEPGAIGITIVWGYFTGPPGLRELIEWDQVYDQADFGWSEDCLAENCTSRMDFGNIAIHEMGHSVGMADLYTGDCSEQTMYGYADYGETKKRTLESGDIAGIRKLY